MITIIQSVLKSLELYLSLKNKKFILDMFETHQTRELKLIQDIENLRAKGTTESNDKADLLRKQLVSYQKDWQETKNLYEKNTIQ